MAQVAFHMPRPEDIAEIRAIVKPFSRETFKRGRERVSVRKGTGSIKHAIQVQCTVTTVEERIAIVEKLKAAGFESIYVHYDPNMGLEEHHIRLAREWNHARLSVEVAKVAS